jgi:hypothetical protein
MTLYVPLQAGDFGAVYAGKQEKVLIPRGIDVQVSESLSLSSDFKEHDLRAAHLKLIKEQIMTPEYVTKLLLSKVNEKEKEILIGDLTHIVWMTDGPGAHYYSGLPHAMQRTQQDIDNGFKRVEKIFKEKDIAIDHLERYAWFYNLNDALSPNPKINITRIDKAELLMALFNTAHYTIAGPVINLMREMTLKDAQKIIKASSRARGFDYLNSKPLKIDIWHDIMDARTYNYNNGRGAAHYAVKQALKNTIKNHLKDQDEKGRAHLKALDDLCKKSGKEKVTTNALASNVALGFWCLKDNNSKELIIDDKTLRESGVMPVLQHVPEGANGTIRIEDADKVKKQVEEALCKKWEAECFESK